MAAAVDQLSESVEQMRDRAHDSQVLSQESSRMATEGGQIIHSTADEMAHIADAIKTAANSIRSLEEYSGNISSPDFSQRLARPRWSLVRTGKLRSVGRINNYAAPSRNFHCKQCPA